MGIVTVFKLISSGFGNSVMGTLTLFHFEGGVFYDSWHLLIFFWVETTIYLAGH